MSDEDATVERLVMVDNEGEAAAPPIELARRWLEMHETSGGDGGGGLPEKLSKAARVLKDLVFEQSVTDNVELPPEATGMARVAA